MTHASTLKPTICIGEILIDLIADPGESLATSSGFAIREGGAPMNAAVALRRLGVPSRFCGVVGNDGFGMRLRALLGREDVDSSSLRTVDVAPTSIAYAWRDDRGDGHFQLIRMADVLLDASDIEHAGIPDASALLIGSVALAAEPSRSAIQLASRIAHQHAVPVVFDVNVRPTIWPNQAALLAACEPVLRATTILKVSLDDARHLWDVSTAEDVAKRARDYPFRLIVITDGDREVAVIDPRVDRIRRFDVRPVEAVDPTGAGDAFTAALVSRLLNTDWGSPAAHDIRFAMAAGALATTRQGALPALPTLDELMRYLQDNA